MATPQTVPSLEIAEKEGAGKTLTAQKGVAATVLLHGLGQEPAVPVDHRDV